ncbi:MAG: phage tail tape measure protein [Actinomycetota bacterium]
MAGGQLTIRFVGDTKEFDGAAQGLGGKLQGLGRTLTRTLTPAALAIGALFAKSFAEWDRGVDAIRVGTGATGKALEALEGSMKSVAGKVTSSLGDVGEAMADLQTRTGQTGKPLEDLTKQFLDLERITGEAADSTIPSITRLFGDWSIATEDQAATMDKLFRASQVSGVGIQTLSELMVQFGSPLRQLGLDFDTTAAMFARFEQEGVNIQTAMPGLRMALKNFAEAGREPAPALLETIEQIKNAATTAEANTIAFEVFGTRAGPDLAAAIREGRFELDEYIGVIAGGTDTIQTAAADTLDLSDKFKMLANQVMAALGPVGEIGAIFFGVLAAIGPLVFGLSQLGPALALAGTAFKGLWAVLTLNPFVAIAAAVVAVGALIVSNWDAIKAFLVSVWDGIKAVATSVWNAIAGFFTGVWEGVKGAFTTTWNAIKGVLVGIWEGIKGVAQGVWNAIKAAILDPIKAVASVLDKIWEGIKKAAVGAWEGIKGAVIGAVNAVIGAIKTLIGWIKTAIEWLGDLVARHSEAERRAGAQILFGAPGRAHGGVVTEPFSLVGERGPELVSLPTGSRVHTASETRRMLASPGGDTHVHFHGDVYGLDDFERRVTEATSRAVRRR